MEAGSSGASTDQGIMGCDGLWWACWNRSAGVLSLSIVVAMKYDGRVQGRALGVNAGGPTTSYGVSTVVVTVVCFVRTRYPAAFTVSQVEDEVGRVCFSHGFSERTNCFDR